MADVNLISNLADIEVILAILNTKAIEKTTYGI
jgi:hypothetical protein